jgi:hypothetical protein
MANDNIETRRCLECNNTIFCYIGDNIDYCDNCEEIDRTSFWLNIELDLNKEKRCNK